MSALKHLFLIDGSGFIFRAFYALPPMTRPDGTPVNAVYGFVNMLTQTLGATDADHVAVVFDAGRKTFRNEIYPAYKANRSEPPEDLVPQFPLIREATEAYNVAMLEREGFEADDLIASYAGAAAETGAEVTIVSSDKDLMQLLRDRVLMQDPKDNSVIDLEKVNKKFGVPPDKVVDVQALAGDSTDNVPGVPGIGVKTAAQLILEYGDLDSLLARADEIKQKKRRENLIEYADQARLSRELVRLRVDLDIDPPFEALAVRKPDPARLRAFLEQQGFKSILKRVEALHIVNNGPGSGPGQGGGASGQPAAATDDRSGGTASAVGKGDYELVDTLDRLDAWIARAYQAGRVAVDTETTSLDAVRAELVGVSLSVEPGAACYVPLAHKERAGQGQLDFAGEGTDDDAKDGAGAARLVAGQISREDALDRLRPLLADPGVLKIGHNLKYDALVLARHGLELHPFDDTMILSYVLEGGAHGHGMDELAQLHLGHTTIKFKDVAGIGRQQVTFDFVPLEKACEYAAEDADITLRLHDLLKPRLSPEKVTTVYETMDRPLVPVVVEMERAGIKVDRDELERLSTDFAARMDGLADEIYRLAGREFTIASPKQLGEILFDEMGFAGGKKTKSGGHSTGADILEDLAAEGHEFPQRILDWRQLAKLKSTYSDALVAQINPETGRVHTSYSLAATSTGRLASTEPNLQNIPIRTEEGRKIRKAFVAEKGHVLLSVDYSQIELRLLAHVAGIEKLQEAFRDGADIHAMTASQVFGVDMAAMDPQTRRRAKAINFGIIYGISPFGLARQLAIPQSEARAYIETYFERYPGIQDYMEGMKAYCREHGYVKTIFGRKCHVPGIRDKSAARRNFSERAAINAPLQGAAADIIRRAMIRVPPALAEAGLQARMLLQVHDELLFEVPRAELEETSALVKTVMEHATLPAIQLDVPLVADTGAGANWSDAH